MDSVNPGAGGAFIDNYMSIVATFAHNFRCVCVRAVKAVMARRPTLETIKTIISISLDLTRTALACMSAASEWGQPATA